MHVHPLSSSSAFNVTGLPQRAFAAATSNSATTSSTNSTSGSGSGSGTVGLSNDESLGTTFLNLLATEMQDQDPTQPMDPTAMVGQMISLNQLDQLISINQTLSGLNSTTTTSGSSGSSSGSGSGSTSTTTGAAMNSAAAQQKAYAALGGN